MKRSKLACLKGGHTPEVVLSQALEQVRDGRVSTVIVGLIHPDGSVSSDWSQTKLSIVSYCLHTLRLILEDEMREAWIQEDYEPPSPT